MGYARIGDLNALKETWAIQARLCRMWEAVDFKNNNEVFALEMIFVDDQVYFGSPLHSTYVILYPHLFL